MRKAVEVIACVVFLIWLISLIIPNTLEQATAVTQIISREFISLLPEDISSYILALPPISILCVLLVAKTYRRKQRGNRLFRSVEFFKLSSEFDVEHMNWWTRIPEGYVIDIYLVPPKEDSLKQN